jgi:hypothetical protein
MTALLVLVLFSAALAQPADEERAAVLRAMQVFFDTMTARDVDGARKILQPQGRFPATSTAASTPST